MATTGAIDAVDGDSSPGEAVSRSTRLTGDVRRRLRGVHPAAWCVVVGAAIFTIVFGSLGVQNHRNFGTWSFDMGIYDQAFWLISRGKSWNTVRGIDVWGHHVNLIAYAFAPFYWLGAGPSFLYVVQTMALGAGAIPTYLIARDRLRSPWRGAVIALAFLMYAPVQWIAWANFHPEALVITPLLFAWWFATRLNWRWCYISIALALSTREDAAMVVVVMGIVLWATLRWSPTYVDRRDQRMALAISLIGVFWYLLCMRLVIPHFNRGDQPFYIDYFYGNYGSSTGEIVKEIISRPDRVVSDATQPDRIRFYRDLLLPWGGLPLAGAVPLVMAVPQMLASVIGLSPYARSIRYQYTAMMIAPIVIAAIEGTAIAMRYKVTRVIVLPWLVLTMYVSNVAWSPSPISPNDTVWARPSPRHDVIRQAIALVPDDVSVTATYGILPHLSHREQIYDWPNPWRMAYFGNDDGYRLPDPSVIEYLVVDRLNVSDDDELLIDELTAVGGEFEVLFEESDVLVARRVRSTPPAGE